MSSYYIFPIGDWSGDGHAFNADFLVYGEKDLDEVRETHLQENEFIGNLCKEYNQKIIDVENLKYFLLNIKSSNLKESTINDFLNKLINDCELKFDSDYEEIYMNPEGLVRLWVFILNILNPDLKLKVVSDATSHKDEKFKLLTKDYVKRKDISNNINFYGCDNKGRHLKTPGYGVWDSFCDTRFYLDCN